MVAGSAGGAPVAGRRVAGRRRAGFDTAPAVRFVVDETAARDPAMSGGRSRDAGSELHQAVARVVAAIPRGAVVSYGEVAVRAGYPGAARAAGHVLATSRGLPWWRVVRSDGRLAAGDVRDQAARLRAEGVAVEKGRIADPETRRRLPPDFTTEGMPPNRPRCR